MKTASGFSSLTHTIFDHLVGAGNLFIGVAAAMALFSPERAWQRPSTSTQVGVNKVDAWVPGLVFHWHGYMLSLPRGWKGPPYRLHFTAAVSTPIPCFIEMCRFLYFCREQTNKPILNQNHPYTAEPSSPYATNPKFSRLSSVNLPHSNNSRKK